MLLGHAFPLPACFVYTRLCRASSACVQQLNTTVPRLVGEFVDLALAEAAEHLKAPMLEVAPDAMVAIVTGQPSMSLPSHWTEDGLPMGMLFTARIGDRRELAAQLKRERPWHERRAPHSAA